MMETELRLINTWFGSLVIDGKGNIVESRLMAREPAIIAEKLFKNDFFEFEGIPKQEILKTFSFRDLALKSGFAGSEHEYNKLLQIVCIELARKSINQTLNQRDQKIKQAIKTLDELDNLCSLLGERLKGFYSLRHPEVTFSGEQLAAFVVKASTREDVAGAIERISIGAHFSERDFAIVERLALDLLELHRTKRGIAKYVEEEMQEVAPNVAILAGGLLGARLICLAGGLKQLAEMPASSIQILGAKGAIFMHLHRGKKPPKHGIIYCLPVIQKSPSRIRGRIARAVASKLAIAARRDFYSGELLEELEIELSERINQIIKQGEENGV